MITFPNCKINLGLHITAKRPDGYHDIETVLFPVPWCDILEIVPADDATVGDTLTVSGRAVNCPPEKNLVMKALAALRHRVSFPAVDVHLHKVIPDGAGLGGGSADASFAIRMANDIFGLRLGDEAMAEVAAEVGSDCPFFIYNRPMLATGRGTTLTDATVDLGGKTIVIAKPEGASVSTAAAYASVTPRLPETPLSDILSRPVEEWQGRLRNDFQEGVIAIEPSVGEVLHSMLDAGATYAAMSGSGAALFGIFDNDNAAETLTRQLTSCAIHVCKIPRR